MAGRYSFPKSERIFLQREIDALFEEGDSFISFPLRVVFSTKPPASGSRASVFISVPKKRIRQAVKRNRIKRLIREAYRLNKPDFLNSMEGEDKRILVAFIYIGNEVKDYCTMEAAMIKALDALTAKLS